MCAQTQSLPRGAKTNCFIVLMLYILIPLQLRHVCCVWNGLRLPHCGGKDRVPVLEERVPRELPASRCTHHHERLASYLHGLSPAWTKAPRYAGPSILDLSTIPARALLSPLILRNGASHRMQARQGRGWTLGFYTCSAGWPAIVCDRGKERVGQGLPPPAAAPLKTVGSMDVGT